ncbi:MAG: FAD-dependent oxidoreductase, partial [Pseudomonadota bacterium]
MRKFFIGAAVTIHDFRTDPAPATMKADVAIVGAGAAGITLALSLSRRGYSVCLLESGGDDPDPDTQSLYDMEYAGYAHREGYYPRIRMLGGSTSIWAGRSMTLQGVDLDGTIANRDLSWPIPLSEIDRFLNSAGEYLELPELHNLEIQPHQASLTLAEKTILGVNGLAPAISLWAVKPQRFGKKFRREIDAAPTLQLWTYANVTRIVTDDSDRHIKAVQISSLQGRVGRVEAAQFVLACGGIETPRLLLNTPGPHRKGLGNSSDHVGRYFMDHPRTVFGRAVLNPEVTLNLSRGLPISHGKIQLGFRASDKAIRAEGLLNHYCTFEEETSGYVQQTY